MTSGPDDDADYRPGIDQSLYDSRGNLIDADYVDRVSREAEIGYDVEGLEPVRVGRPSLSDSGDSPQVRFRLPAATRAEAADVAAREGKTLSQLAREAVEAYLDARRSA
jgi:hypothetical protein